MFKSYILLVLSLFLYISKVFAWMICVISFAHFNGLQLPLRVFDIFLESLRVPEGRNVHVTLMLKIYFVRLIIQFLISSLFNNYIVLIAISYQSKQGQVIVYLIHYASKYSLPSKPSKMIKD